MHPAARTPHVSFTVDTAMGSLNVMPQVSPGVVDRQEVFSLPSTAHSGPLLGTLQKQRNTSQQRKRHGSFSRGGGTQQNSEPWPGLQRAQRPFPAAHCPHKHAHQQGAHRFFYSGR